MNTWTAILLIVIMTVLGFLLGWFSKTTPAVSYPAKSDTVAVHDTIAVHDTVSNVPAFPGNMEVVDSALQKPPAVVIEKQKEVLIHTRIGSGMLNMRFRLPDDEYPNGLVVRATLDQVRFRDTVLVRIPVPVPETVYTTDWSTIGIVSGIVAVLAFLLGLSV